MKMVEICIHQREMAISKLPVVPNLLLSYLETKDSLDKLAANLVLCDDLDHLKRERGKELTFDQLPYFVQVQNLNPSNIRNTLLSGEKVKHHYFNDDSDLSIIQN